MLQTRVTSDAKASDVRFRVAGTLEDVPGFEGLVAEARLRSRDTGRCIGHADGHPAKAGDVGQPLRSGEGVTGPEAIVKARGASGQPISGIHGDDKLTAQDAAQAAPRPWQEANREGATDAGARTTLEVPGIGPCFDDGGGAAGTAGRPNKPQRCGRSR